MSPVLIHPGIYRITLPLFGTKPGPVNVYLFKGRDNVTLIDAGTHLSVKRLEAGLKKIGLDFSSIDRLVLTHGHVDHYGGARTLRRKGSSHLRICAHPEDIRAVETGADAPLKAYQRFLIHTGTPIHMILGIIPMFLWLRRLSRPCPVDEPLNDGNVLQFGDYRGRIIATPGHTRGSICVHLESENLLFAGDHILSHITPNALPMFEDGIPLPLRSSQMEFFRSLEVIERLKPAMVFGAHGKPIRDFSTTHRLYRDFFAERQAAVLHTLRNHPGKSIYAMARAHFPDMKGHRFLLDLFLAISEIYTHVQVLEREGRVMTKIINRTIHVEFIK